MNLTRQKFLAHQEVDDVVAFLSKKRQDARGTDVLSAQLDELIVSALLFSGLRNSEFCGLAVGDTIVGSGDSVFVVRGLQARSRTVYVPRSVSEAVLDYVRDVRPRLLPRTVAADDLAEPLVFNEHRRPFDRSGLYRRVVRILAEAGLGERASVQLLRHTYGYLSYLRTGGNLLFVQRQLGHAHPRITSVYSEFVDESYPDLAERVAAHEQSAATIEYGVYARRVPQFDCEID